MTGTPGLAVRKARTNSAPLLPGMMWSVMMAPMSSATLLLSRARALSWVAAMWVSNPALRSTASRARNCTGLSSMRRTAVNPGLTPAQAILLQNLQLGAEPVFPVAAVLPSFLLVQQVGADANLVFQAV